MLRARELLDTQKDAGMNRADARLMRKAGFDARDKSVDVIAGTNRVNAFFIILALRVASDATNATGLLMRDIW